MTSQAEARKKRKERAMFLIKVVQKWHGVSLQMGKESGILLNLSYQHLHAEKNVLQLSAWRGFRNWNIMFVSIWKSYPAMVETQVVAKQFTERNERRIEYFWKLNKIYVM